MSKKRNTNKVRKALKRKRQQYHTGSNVTHRFAGRQGRWIPHNPATHGVGGGGGGGGGGQPNPNPNPNPDPDPTPPKTSQPAGEGQGTLTDTSGPKEAPRQEVELGETFTPEKADVEKLDVGGGDLTTQESRDSGLTPEEDIQKLEDYTPVTAPTMPGYQATAAQGKVSRALTPEDYRAAGFTATQAKNLPTTRRPYFDRKKSGSAT